jgi:hypothetical protein
MTLTTHPHSVPDALVATLPTGIAPSFDDAPTPRLAAPGDDRLGTGCPTCDSGTYGPGPGAGHVTCSSCGHATVRRGTVGLRRR